MFYVLHSCCQLMDVTHGWKKVLFYLKRRVLSNNFHPLIVLFAFKKKRNIKYCPRSIGCFQIKLVCRLYISIISINLFVVTSIMKFTHYTYSKCLIVCGGMAYKSWCVSHEKIMFHRWQWYVLIIICTLNRCLHIISSSWIDK